MTNILYRLFSVRQCLSVTFPHITRVVPSNIFASTGPQTHTNWAKFDQSLSQGPQSDYRLCFFSVIKHTTKNEIMCSVIMLVRDGVIMKTYICWGHSCEERRLSTYRPFSACCHLPHMPHTWQREVFPCTCLTF